MQLRDISRYSASLFKSPKGKLIIKWLQKILLIGIITWLGFELTNIGWSNVWKSLPLQPLFYFTFLIIYFQLPLFELWVYRCSWSFVTMKDIPIFIIKRVYNKDVLGYSGEIYFFMWAKKKMIYNGKYIFQTIKDNNIISSIASTVFSIMLLSIFFFTGQLPVEVWFTSKQLVYWISGMVVVLVLILVFYRFRNYIFHMKWSTALIIFGIQMIRLFMVQALNLLMFYIVIPDTPLYVWFSYLSIEIILSRVPFLPNKDFIFVSLSITLADSLNVNESAIAGLMLARSVLGKVANLILFTIFGNTKIKEINQEKFPGSFNYLRPE